jgi:hypothetical protein
MPACIHVDMSIYIYIYIYIYALCEHDNKYKHARGHAYAWLCPFELGVNEVRIFSMFWFCVFDFKMCVSYVIMYSSREYVP